MPGSQEGRHWPAIKWDGTVLGEFLGSEGDRNCLKQPRMVGMVAGSSTGSECAREQRAQPLRESNQQDGMDLISR